MQSSGGKLMSAIELAEYLGVTRHAAYTLLHSSSFPSIQIGNLLFALSDEVDIWLKRQAEEGGYTYDETSTR